MSYFSSGNYQLQSGRQAWSFTGDLTRSSKFDVAAGLVAEDDTLRFEVRGGDLRLGDPSTKERSEIRDLNRFDFGETYTIQYKFMIEPGEENTAKWLMISQIHQTEDVGDIDAPPVLALVLRGERLALEVRAEESAITTIAPPGRTVFLDDTDVVRGKWYDVALEVKLDPWGNGLVNLWLDGEQVSQYEGAVGYNDIKGPYWKMGVYRAQAAETFAVDFKEFGIVEGVYTPQAPDIVEPAHHGGLPYDPYAVTPYVDPYTADPYAGSPYWDSYGWNAYNSYGYDSWVY